MVKIQIRESPFPMYDIDGCIYVVGNVDKLGYLEVSQVFEAQEIRGNEELILEWSSFTLFFGNSTNYYL